MLDVRKASLLMDSSIQAQSFRYSMHQELVVAVVRQMRISHHVAQKATFAPSDLDIEGGLHGGSD